MIFAKRLSAAALLAAPLILSLAAGTAQAAGFYLQEQSVSGLGAAFAGQAAMARDASILYYNPSGLAQLGGAEATLGVQLISPRMKLRDEGTQLNGGGLAFAFAPGAPGIGSDTGGTPTGPTPVPSAYIAAPVTDDGSLWLGFGVSSPFGLESKYDSGYFGRFDSTASKLRTFDLQPTVAFKPVDWFSVGATLIAEYADADLKSIALLPVANGAPPPAYFVGQGEFRLKGDDWAYGANIGVTLKPDAGTTLGFDYRSQIRHELQGTVDLEGQFSGEPAHASLDLPDIATAALARKFGDRWTGLAQVSWYGWHSFDTIAPQRDDGFPLTTEEENYKDSWSFAIGAEYAATPEWTLRAGYQHDQAPVQDEYRTTRIPDGDRDWFALGATYNWSQRLSFDVGAAYIDVAQGGIDRQEGVGADIVEVRARSEDSWIGILSLGVNYKF
jgi:long-chain fatty acid transport protein